MYLVYYFILYSLRWKKGKKRPMSKQSIRRTHEYYNWDILDEGRLAIHDWSRSRIQKMQGLNKSYYGCLVYSFHWETLRSFVENFNFMVILQMIFAAVGVFIFDHYEISYNFNTGLFISPIVFPLAFSINTDFQRREKVLDDLANFKASSMLYFFCMREWKKGAGLSDAWMNQIQRKLHSIMFNLREYLLTSRKDRRKIIARYMYEDYSDCSQLIDNLRESKKLPSNPALISRAYHLLNGMCLSFERLRVIREYRSPRSIRSFNKVLVLLLPIFLCPYFVAMARANGANHWGAYFIAVLVAAVFGALQGVQDKLDDPFDGMSEDDINLDTIDEWTFNSLQSAVNRNFTGDTKFRDDEKPGSRKTSESPIISPVTSKDTVSQEQTPASLGFGVSSDALSPQQLRRKTISELILEMNIKEANKKKKNPFKRISSKAVKMETKRRKPSSASVGESQQIEQNGGEVPLIKHTIPSHPKSPGEKSVTFEDVLTMTDANTKKEQSVSGEESAYYNDLGEKTSQDGRQAEEQPLLPPLPSSETTATGGKNDKGNESDDSFQVVVM